MGHLLLEFTRTVPRRLLNQGLRAVAFGLVLASALLVAPWARAAAPDLFISEYIEGSSLNKAIEIYNGTGEEVALEAYSLAIYFNGNTTAGTTLALSGALVDGETYVIADDGADPAVLAIADLTPGNSFFNGDDALELLHDGVVVDSFGQVGVDPGSQWPGGGADDTLRRKPTLCAGDTDSSDAFDASVEWDVFSTNDFSDLGTHDADCGGPPEPEASPEPEPEPETTCGEPADLIHDVQGAGLSSPLVGESVTVEGVVVGDFPGFTGLSGFYMQEEDADADADPLTSEGVFVYLGGTDPGVSVGDLVRITGVVAEFNNLTELSGAQLEICGAGLSVTPAAPNLPVASLDDWERFEGMSVVFSQTLVSSESYNLGRYGELLLAAGERLYQGTNVAEPGAPALAVEASNELRSIVLDDGSDDQNPDPVPHLSVDGVHRLGDSVTGLRGVLSENFGAYSVQPTQPVDFQRTDPRDEFPADTGGSLKVASFNVLNYFTTLDNGLPICGPAADQDCRGADSPLEFEQQRAKIIDALWRMDADVVGLIELENNTVDAIADLVSGLNDVSSRSYAFVDTGTLGGDAIRVGVIYDELSVVPTGPYAILDASVDPGFIDTKNRPVLAQSFEQLSSGEVLTVAVNHLKSKGSDCNDVGDPDLGDGQGNCNQTRLAAAQAELNWLMSDPTGSGDPDFLVVGDLNAYAKEDPVEAFRDAGFTDLIGEFVGPLSYSYVFDGRFGYLDHALASPSLLAQVSGVTEWHINADEVRIFDCNEEFKPSVYYTPDAFRSSDHDPVLVGLSLASGPATPQCDGLAATIYVDGDGKVVGGPLDSTKYAGWLLGTAGDDVMVGTDGAELITGRSR